MSITGRTIFRFTKPDGSMGFADWALTNTTLGLCAEPFNPKETRAAGYVDQTDEMARFTDIRTVDCYTPDMGINTDKVRALHGGQLIPKA